MNGNETRQSADADQSMIELTLDELNEVAGGACRPPSPPSPIPIPYPNLTLLRS